MKNAAAPAKPYRITEAGKRTIAASTYRQAQVAVARRIASDVEGRVLVITGPNGSTVCTNNRMTGGIIYQGVAA